MSTHSGLNADRIPIKRLRSTTQIQYISALPRLLAQGQSDQIASITGHLLEQIHKSQVNFSFSSKYLSLPKAVEYGVIATSQVFGTIEFELQDTAIAFWLNQLLHSHFTPEPTPAPLTPPPTPQSLFFIQHAHARCCSLIQHAHQAGLADFSYNKPYDWMSTESTPINWLTSSQQIPLNHPAERQLISQLLVALDFWTEPVSAYAKHRFLLAQAISVAFHNVHRAFQLFGHPPEITPDRLQVYLGLILVTQRVLFQLLHSLQIVAPFEL